MKVYDHFHDLGVQKVIIALSELGVNGVELVRRARLELGPNTGKAIEFGVKSGGSVSLATRSIVSTSWAFWRLQTDYVNFTKRHMIFKA